MKKVTLLLVGFLAVACNFNSSVSYTNSGDDIERGIEISRKFYSCQAKHDTINLYKLFDESVDINSVKEMLHSRDSVYGMAKSTENMKGQSLNTTYNGKKTIQYLVETTVKFENGELFEYLQWIEEEGNEPKISEYLIYREQQDFTFEVED